MPDSEKSPSNWQRVRLTEIADLNPRHFSIPAKDDTIVSFVPMKSVQEGTGRLDSSEERSWSEVKKGYTPFQDDDVIFAKITPCMENGKFAIAKHLSGGRAAGSTEFHVFRPTERLDSHFLLFFLFSPQVRHAARLNMRGAAGQLRVPSAFFETLEISVPPVDIQRQVVASIEKQLTRLEVGEAVLARILVGLKRYRSAVLKAACNGHLIRAEATEISASRDRETASALLKQILTTRRMLLGGRSTYKEPTQIDPRNYPQLPQGWVWVTLEQVTSLITSGSRGWGRFYSEVGPLFIRAQDIKTDALNLEGAARVEIGEDTEGTRSLVENDDLLVTITGANVTKSAIARGLTEPAFVSQHVALIKPVLRACAKYLYFWIISPAHGRSELEKWAYGAAKPGLNLAQLRSLPIALPPLAEQKRIVAEVDRRLSVIDGLEALVKANLHRAVRLRQSVFQKAFSEAFVFDEAGSAPSSRAAGTQAEKNHVMPKRPAPTTTKEVRPLVEILSSTAEAVSPDELFVLSGRDPTLVENVEDFFSELRDLVKRGVVEELRPDKATAKLRATS